MKPSNVSFSLCGGYETSCGLEQLRLALVAGVMLLLMLLTGSYYQQ